MLTKAKNDIIHSEQVAYQFTLFTLKSDSNIQLSSMSHHIELECKELLPDSGVHSQHLSLLFNGVITSCHGDKKNRMSLGIACHLSPHCKCILSYDVSISILPGLADGASWSCWLMIKSNTKFRSNYSRLN